MSLNLIGSKANSSITQYILLNVKNLLIRIIITFENINKFCQMFSSEELISFNAFIKISNQSLNKPSIKCTLNSISLCINCFSLKILLELISLIIAKETHFPQSLPPNPSPSLLIGKMITFGNSRIEYINECDRSYCDVKS